MRSPYRHYADFYISEDYIIHLSLFVVSRCTFWAVRASRLNTTNNIKWRGFKLC